MYGVVRIYHQNLIPLILKALLSNYRLRCYLGNRPHFLWVYRRDNPRGMLGEHSNSL